MNPDHPSKGRLMAASIAIAASYHRGTHLLQILFESQAVPKYVVFISKVSAICIGCPVVLEYGQIDEET